MTRDCDSFPKGLQCKSFDTFVNSNVTSSLNCEIVTLTRLGVDRVKPCSYVRNILVVGRCVVIRIY